MLQRQGAPYHAASNQIKIKSIYFDLSVAVGLLRIVIFGLRSFLRMESVVVVSIL